jgi:hypothetical protein
MLRLPAKLLLTFICDVVNLQKIPWNDILSIFQVHHNGLEFFRDGACCECGSGGGGGDVVSGIAVGWREGMWFVLLEVELIHFEAIGYLRGNC